MASGKARRSCIDFYLLWEEKNKKNTEVRSENQQTGGIRRIWYHGFFLVQAPARKLPASGGTRHMTTHGQSGCRYYVLHTFSDRTTVAVILRCSATTHPIPKTKWPISNPERQIPNSPWLLNQPAAIVLLLPSFIHEATLRTALPIRRPAHYPPRWLVAAGLVFYGQCGQRPGRSVVQGKLQSHRHLVRPLGHCPAPAFFGFWTCIFSARAF